MLRTFAAAAATKLALGKQACGKTVLKPLISFLANSECGPCSAQLLASVCSGPAHTYANPVFLML